MVIRRIIRLPWNLRHTCVKDVKKKLCTRCGRPQLIVCLLCCIFLYSLLTPSYDGVLSDPRDDPVLPGACSPTETSNDMFIFNFHKRVTNTLNIVQIILLSTSLILYKGISSVSFSLLKVNGCRSTIGF